MSFDFTPRQDTPGVWGSRVVRTEDLPAVYDVLHRLTKNHMVETYEGVNYLDFKCSTYQEVLAVLEEIKKVVTPDTRPNYGKDPFFIPRIF